MNFYEAQLQIQRICEETGMSMADVAALPVDEFARLTRGQTPAQAAIAAYNREQDTKEQAQPSAAPPGAPKAPESEPVGIDVNSPEFFHAWRSQRVSGGEGKGIFDSVGSRSEEYRSAARRQAGRTGWANSNVVEPPRIEGRYLRHEDPIDRRTATERFSNQSNFWQGR